MLLIWISVQPCPGKRVAERHEKSKAMDITITHEEKYQQFTMALEDGEEAELAYALPEPGVINFSHTYVPESARGEGLANQLIKEGLRYAEANNYKVIASCPVVARFIKQNNQYRKLLK
jgi:predicted GNAT family acetyltransferase